MPDSSLMYSIDRFTLFLRMELRGLQELKRSQRLADYARSVTPRFAGIDARRAQYRSQLSVVKPRAELFRRLSRSLASADHLVFSVELACDVVCPTKAAAQNRSRQINKVLRQRWSLGARLYGEDRETQDILSGRRRRRRESPHDHELIGRETVYTGTRDFEYKVYARKIPDTERRAVRGEWSISKSATVRRKIGVSTVDDLRRLNLQRTFLTLYEQFIRYEEIDHETHGRFIMKEPHNSPRLRQTAMEVRLAYSMPTTTSHLYMRRHGIKNSSQLRQHYAAEKKRIEVKLRNNRLLTALETRIGKLSPKTIDSFFIPVQTDPFFREPLQYRIRH